MFETCDPVRFHKDGARVYMSTNKGDADLIAPRAARSGDRARKTLVETDPQKRVDFGNAIFSELTDELVATTYEDERTRIYFHDKAFEADYRLVEKKLPGTRARRSCSATADEQLWLVAASSDREPGERYLFDRAPRR